MTSDDPETPLQLRLVTGLFWLAGGVGAAWLLLTLPARAAGFAWAPPGGAAVLGLILAIPLLVTAWGIGRRKLWARWTGIALCLMAIPFFPTGTLLGLFSLGALLSRRSTAYFGGEFM